MKGIHYLKLLGTLGYEPNSIHQYLHRRCNKQYHDRETEINTGKKAGYHNPQEDQQNYMLRGHWR